MPPEAWVTLGTNVPVLLLAIFGVVHFSRELAAQRRSIDELGGRLIDALDGALERSDPRIPRPSDPPEETHDGDTEDLPLLPPPPPKRGTKR